MSCTFIKDLYLKMKNSVPPLKQVLSNWEDEVKLISRPCQHPLSGAKEIFL